VFEKSLFFFFKKCILHVPPYGSTPQLVTHDEQSTFFRSVLNLTAVDTDIEKNCVVVDVVVVAFVG
jgi:hypothetical protein